MNGLDNAAVTKVLGWKLQFLCLKMNKEYKGNLVKRYMVCLFNKFVRHFLEQVRPYMLQSLNKFDFRLGLQKTLRCRCT